MLCTVGGGAASWPVLCNKLGSLRLHTVPGNGGADEGRWGGCPHRCTSIFITFMHMYDRITTVTGPAYESSHCHTGCGIAFTQVKYMPRILAEERFTVGDQEPCKVGVVWEVDRVPCPGPHHITKGVPAKHAHRKNVHVVGGLSEDEQLLSNPRVELAHPTHGPDAARANVRVEVEGAHPLPSSTFTRARCRVVCGPLRLPHLTPYPFESGEEALPEDSL